MAKKTSPKKSQTDRKIPLLIIVGVLLIMLGFWQKWEYKKSLSFQKDFTPVSSSKKHAYTPVSIEINRINVSLPIKQTNIVKGVWEINPKGASHLAASGYPTEKNPIIIYAHNKIFQFGRLSELKNGDIVSIKSNKKEDFFYKVINSQVVTPENVEVLQKTKGNQLILYTCTGFADSKRLLVFATPL